MEEEINLLIEVIKTDPINAVKAFESKKKEKTEEYIKEYDGDRDLRDSQVNNLNKDKTVGTGEKSRLVKKTRLKIDFQKKITRVASAFEVGEPVTLIPNNSDSNLHLDLIASWDNNRIDSKIQELVKYRKSHTEAALLFYISPITEDDLIGKALGSLGVKQKNEIKSRVITNKNANLYPYFDAVGDMIAFGYGFSSKIADKEIKSLWIYTKTELYKIDNSTGNYMLIESLPHGFTKIPVVYTKQELPEWFDVKEMIDRYEVALSKHSDATDYTGHPIIIVEGEVLGAPAKEETGKVFNIPIKFDNDGKPIKGDVRFLTHEQAPEAVKLELDSLENNIYSITSTPNLTFDSVKGLGSISGVALKLLFLDAIIKAKTNEGENRTMYQRIINILISGITKTINTATSKEGFELKYKIEFNSIIPDDLKTAADVINTLRRAGVISKKTAIQFMNLVQDTNQELEEIKLEESTITNTIQ